MGQTQAPPVSRVFGELVGMDVAVHRPVAGGGPQILADGGHIRPHRPQVGQRPQNLLPGFPHPGDQPRLDHPLRAEPFGPGQQSQGPPVIGRGAHLPLQAEHGFGVVVEHRRPGRHHPLQVLRRTFEVGDQNLHVASGNPTPHFGNRLGEHLRAAVRQVVPVDGGDHHVPQPHPGRRLRHPPRLVPIQTGGPPGGHIAEPAGPGADIPQDHHRGRALPPAFVDVGASGLLAHRVQPQLPHHLPHPPVCGTLAGPHPHPLRALRLAGQPPVDQNRNRPETVGGETSVGRQPVHFETAGSALPPDESPQLRLPAAVAESLGEGRNQPLYRFFYGNRAAQQLSKGSDRPVGDPARVHVGEEVHVRVHVQGEPVHGHPPGNPHPDGGRLAPLRPHPRVSGLPPSPRPEAGQGADEGLFHRPHVGDDFAGVGQAENRVADQLAGAVVGDVPAPVDVEPLRPQLRQARLGNQQVGAVPVAPHRIHVGMLHQQQIVGAGAAPQPPLPEGLLQIPGLPVGHPPQPADAQQGRVFD